MAKGLQTKFKYAILYLMNKKRYENLSVLIVEDNIETLNELYTLMNFYFMSVHCAKDGCEGLKLIDKFHPDVIISDINMPCLNGVEMLKEAKKSNSNSILIFATAHNELNYLHSAIELKIDAYLVKPIQTSLLFDKIDNILKDRVIINKQENIFSISSSKLLHHRLSKRENEVFLDISKGIKPNNIAQKYGVKSKTISTYRRRIFEKMSLNSNAEVVRYAIHHNLI